MLHPRWLTHKQANKHKVKPPMAGFSQKHSLPVRLPHETETTIRGGLAKDPVNSRSSFGVQGKSTIITVVIVQSVTCSTTHGLPFLGTLSLNKRHNEVHSILLVPQLDSRLQHCTQYQSQPDTCTTDQVLVKCMCIIKL